MDGDDPDAQEGGQVPAEDALAVDLLGDLQNPDVVNGDGLWHDGTVQQ